jgi:prolipoprotein diacylglyceryltransferase
MFRWFLFSLICSVFISIILAAGLYYVIVINEGAFEYTYFQIIFLFGLPLLLGMAILGAIGCLLKSAWYKWRKPDIIFKTDKQ